MKIVLKLVLVIVLTAWSGVGTFAHAADDPFVIADSVFDRVDQTLDRAEKARQVYDRVRNLGKSSDEIRKAKEDWERADRDYKQANAKLDSARIDAIADAAGVSRGQVEAMRTSGKGWGAIAKELGLHPSIVSKGAKKSEHAKNKKHGKPEKGKGKKK